MHKLISILCPLLFINTFISVAYAEIYKVIDADGNVQYTSKPSYQDGSNLQTITVTDKYAIKVIEQEQPIAYNSEKLSRLLSIHKFKYDLPIDEDGTAKVGRLTCGRAKELTWDNGVFDVHVASNANSILKVLNENKYDSELSIGRTPAVGSLRLNVTIKDLRINVCYPKQYNKRVYSYNKFQQKAQSFSKNATYVKVLWEVYDPIQDLTLYSGITEGSHNATRLPAVKDGQAISFHAAMDMASVNLVAEHDFVKQLKWIDLKQFIKQFDSELELVLSYGNNLGSFANKSNQVKNAAVLIYTENGHGSGVALTQDGMILTNAHVVGDKKRFKVSINNKRYHADLIRKDSVRDTALLKVDGDYFGGSAVLAIVKPNIGSEIYVIGAPLKTSLNQTVTRGIISAERNTSGLSYYQTDASIHPGNSGGPVYNEHGELVAITVAGYFSKSGSGMDINYLIPIKEAMASLNIKNNQNRFSLATLSDEISIPLFRTMFVQFLDWCNEPAFE